VLRALVENYLEQVGDPNFRPAGGLWLPSQDPARPLPPQRPDLLGRALLPAAAREAIEARAAECLIVVPDGALHKLPFEALLLRADDRAYVLDELPPLVYAPSVAILAALADRPGPAGPRSLLTVTPAYPEAGKGRAAGAPPHGLLGQLPPLKHARQESKQISRFFDRKLVKTLDGKAATKTELLAALPGRRVVHIAAHGFADERFDNKFGGLALAWVAGPGAVEDSFLALHEVHHLRLGGCELAVLSACHTNAGPQPPLEAGVTLAGAFLAAGARRVVASHWGVDDESTARLVAAFFKNLTAAAGDRRPAGHAWALREARRQVRDRAGKPSPYFWAPFVLVGPPG
jgi:CHAT domain-containing protein